MDGPGEQARFKAWNSELHRQGPKDMHVHGSPALRSKLVGLDRVRLGSQTVVDPNPAALQALERVVDGQPKTPMDTSFQGS